jgi:hypothetical protein
MLSKVISFAKQRPTPFNLCVKYRNCDNIVYQGNEQQFLTMNVYIQKVLLKQFLNEE